MVLSKMPTTILPQFEKNILTSQYVLSTRRAWVLSYLANTYCNSATHVLNIDQYTLPSFILVESNTVLDMMLLGLDLKFSLEYAYGRKEYVFYSCLHDVMLRVIRIVLVLTREALVWYWRFV